jgi:hypothetical protein
MMDFRRPGAATAFHDQGEGMLEPEKGRYQQGKFELDEPLDLQDGTEVVVTVTPTAPLPTDGDPCAASEGAWAGNVPDDFEEQVYTDRRRETTRPPSQW